MYVHGYSQGGEGTGMAAAIPGQTTTPVSSAEMAQIRELKIAHFCNLAMCHMKHGPKYAKAKDNCTKALAIDPDNVKGQPPLLCPSPPRCRSLAPRGLRGDRSHARRRGCRAWSTQRCSGEGNATHSSAVSTRPRPTWNACSSYSPRTRTR